MTTGALSAAPPVRLAGSRHTAGSTRGIGSGVTHSIYNSWWDPIYSPYGYGGSWASYGYGWGLSWSWGLGYCGYGYSWLLPLYWTHGYYWSSYYRDCWWRTWSSPVWTPSYYWWYPSTVYCPTYLYVPSSTVYVETVEDDRGEPAPVEPKAEEVVVAESKAEPAAGSIEALAKKYFELGDFYFKAGRFADAADAYARARTYAPDDAPLHFVLADAAFAMGDYHFAAFLIAEALRLDPGLAAADVDKREFYGDAALFEEHMASLEKYLASHANDASAHLVRGYNLRFSGRANAASAAFRRVLEIEPGHRAAALFLEALTPRPEGDKAKSEARKGEETTAKKDR